MFEGDEDVDYIKTENIQSYIQYFLDHTRMAEELGFCILPEEMWPKEIERFKKTFRTDYKGEHKVEVSRLFDFIQEVMLHLIEYFGNEMIEEGKLELGWDPEAKDFCYLKKDSHKED